MQWRLSYIARTWTRITSAYASHRNLSSTLCRNTWSLLLWTQCELGSLTWPLPGSLKHFSFKSLGMEYFFSHPFPFSLLLPPPLYFFSTPSTISISSVYTNIIRCNCIYSYLHLFLVFVFPFIVFSLFHNHIFILYSPSFTTTFSYCILPLSQPHFHSSHYFHSLLFKIILFLSSSYNWLVWFSVWMSYHVKCFWAVTPVFWFMFHILYIYS